MYPNYIEDRKSLGYEALIDTSCGRQLVLITDSTVLIIKNFPLNLKVKSKRIIIIGMLGGALWFSDVQPSSAIGLSMPYAPVVRVQPSFQDSLKKPEFAKLIPRKPDRISYKYFSRSKEELLLLIYAPDPQLSSNPQVLKIIKDLRGGSWGLVGTTAFLGLIILIFSMGEVGEGFVPNNPDPGWGVVRPNPF